MKEAPTENLVHELQEWANSLNEHHFSGTISLCRKAAEKIERFERALNHIAYEPLGHAEATDRECLETATNIAKEALKS